MKNSFFNPFVLKKRIYQSIDSQEVFQALLDRERGRSDRNGSYFSLMSLTIEKTNNGDDILRLISALKNRLRSIDELGWIDSRRIGVLLPDTTFEGAMELAQDIKNQLDIKYKISSANASINFNIQTYPDKKNGPIDSLNKSSAKKPKKRQDELLCLIGKPMPAWKRALDIIGAGLALILLFPIMLCIGILIKSVSPGPALFKQERIGFACKPFMCWKFRTMHCDTDPDKHREHVCQLIQNGKQWNKLDDRPDAGIIPFGNILRKSGLDELPQLINVLRGEMSLIGPRPCIAYEAAEFKPWQAKRFDTHPGLTGLWQVSGKNSTTFEQMIRLDISYGRKRTILKDAVIFLKTFPVVIKQSLKKL